MYYDIVFDSCKVDDDLSARLGFSKIGIIPKDIGFINLETRGPSGEKNVIAAGPVGKLISASNSGIASIYVNNAEIDKKLLASMADNGVVLCIALSDIMEPHGLKRSHLIFKLGRLFAYAKKEGLDVAFVTLARSRSSMCSYMQMIELAKLVGADEDYARKSVSEINKKLMG